MKTKSDRYRRVRAALRRAARLGWTGRKRRLFLKNVRRAVAAS
jgi:hypothetical protein